MKKYLNLLVILVLTMTSCTNKSDSQIGTYEDGLSLDELGDLNRKALSFEDAGDFHGDLLAVKLDGVWGLLNYKTDELVIDFKYDTISYSNGWWHLDITDAWAVNKSDVADENGKILIVNGNLHHTCPLTKDILVSRYENGTNIKNVLIDSKLKPLSTDTFFMYNNQGNNIVLSGENGSDYTIVSVEDNGVTIKRLSDLYEEVRSCSDVGFYAVKDNSEKWGFIDKDGQQLLPCKYGAIQNGFENGLAIVGENWDALNTIINIDGTEVLKLDYAENIFPFSEGLAGVNTERGCVFVDESGSKKIELDNVKYCSGFVNDVAIVGQEGEDDFGSDSKSGVINKDGDYIIPLQDEYIEEAYISNGFIVVCNDILAPDSHYGLYNIKGERVLETKYDLISYAEKGVIRVKINGHSYYVNQKGETGLANLNESIAKGEENKNNYINTPHSGLFDRMQTIRWNIYYTFDRIRPNILKDISYVKNLNKLDNGTYEAEVEFEYSDGKYFYKLSNMRFNSKGHFENTTEPWKADVKYVPNMRHIDHDNEVYSLPFHLPNAEEQLLYYNEKLMQGNRYNPFK